MVDSVGTGLGAQQQAAQDEIVANQAAISQDDFLEILLTQLTFQDPLKPLDNQEFVAQMAQFTNLEQTRQLNANSEILLTVQSATQSIGLIGKTVTVLTDTGIETGTVTTITFNQGAPEMVINTTNNAELVGIRLADIQSVRN